MEEKLMTALCTAQANVVAAVFELAREPSPARWERILNLAHFAAGLAQAYGIVINTNN